MCRAPHTACRVPQSGFLSFRQNIPDSHTSVFLPLTFNWDEDNPLLIGEKAYKQIEVIYDEHSIVAAYDEVMKHLEDYAQNNPISPVDMAVRHVMVNQPDKVMYSIEKGFEIHDPAMIYIATKMFNLDPLFRNPRFNAICKKMNLPLPKTL